MVAGAKQRSTTQEWHSRILWLLLGAGLIGATLLAAPVRGEDDAGESEAMDERRYNAGAPADPSEAWRLAQGGRLYDMWWGTLLVEPPEESHPAYPKSGAQDGAQTWRCVACHGWDYKGKDGAFGTGPNRTGIKGIRGAMGRAPAEIAALLRAKPHGYTEEMIPDEALSLLALFVSAGQHDAGRYIDRKTRKSRGNAEAGRAVYQNLCAVCHDFDGRAEIFSDEGELATLGAITGDQPWLALHKVLNGQPAADMPALRALDMQTVLDALAYAQTLPRK